MSRTLKNSGIPWVGQIPADWESLPNKYVMTKKKNICPVYHGEPILSLTMDGVIVRDLDNIKGKRPSSFNGYQRIQKGNLLMCLFDIDVTPRCVGLVSQNGLTSPAYSQFVMAENINVKYYYFYYLFLDFTKELLHLAKNLRHSLTEDQLGSIKVPVPSPAEQKKIADFLDKKCGEVDALAHNIQQQIDTLEQYKRAIITETVTKGLNPSAPMKDSGIPWIGQIPKHWAQCKIKNICTLIGSGTTPDSSISMFYDEGTINWIQSGDVYGKSFITNVTTLISQVAFQSSPALKIYSAPFIVIAMYGGSVGNTAISMIDACTNQACCCLKPSPYTDLKFLFYWINFCKEDFLLRAEGGGQPNISQNKIKNQFFCAPPFKEQQAIASYLDDKCGKIDSLIKTKQEQLAKLEEYKKVIIFEYVTGKKEVPEEER